jgi:hypothetical protein
MWLGFLPESSVVTPHFLHQNSTQINQIGPKILKKNDQKQNSRGFLEKAVLFAKAKPPPTEPHFTSNAIFSKTPIFAGGLAFMPIYYRQTQNHRDSWPKHSQTIFLTNKS